MIRHCFIEGCRNKLTYHDEYHRKNEDKSHTNTSHDLVTTSKYCIDV